MSEILLSWGLTYLLHSTILIVSIGVVNLRIRSEFLRDLLWKIALVGGIVTATISTAVPFQMTLPWGSASLADETARLGPPSVESSGLTSAAPLPIELPQFGATQRDVENPGFLATARTTVAATAPVLLILWPAGALLLAARILVGHAQLMRRLKNRELIVTGDDFDLLQSLRERDFVQPVRLSASDAISSPIAMIGSEVVIPREMFRRLGLAQRESILAHELAHLQRRDPLWLCLSEMVCAFLCLQPLNRLVRRQMKETAEFLCDDAALRQTGDRRALAETLAELASAISPVRTSTVAAMVEGKSNLFRRVSRVLNDDGAEDRPLRLTVRLAMVVLPLLVVTVLAPAIDARTDSEPVALQNQRTDSVKARDARARLAQADARLASNDRAGALAAYREAVELDPAIADLGRINRYAGERDPMTPPPPPPPPPAAASPSEEQIIIVETDEPSEETRSAQIEALRQYLRIHPESVEAVTRLAALLPASESETLIGELLRRRPRDPDVYAARGRIRSMSGLFMEALADYEMAGSLDENNPERFYVQGVLAYEMTAKTMTGLDETRKRALIARGLAALERAGSLRTDYFEPLVYRNLLLREQAKLETNTVEREKLIAQADATRRAAIALIEKRKSTP